MQTELSLCMGLLMLIAAGCGIDGSHRPYEMAAEFDSSQSEWVPAAPVAPEVRDSPITLQQCIEIALENNPQVVGGSWDVQAAKAERDAVSGQKWPSLALETGYRHYLDDQRLVMPRYPNESGVYGDDLFMGDLVLRMPIFTAGRLKNEIQAADLLSQSTSHRLARTRQELVFNVSQVFYRILAQRHVVESLEFSKKALEEHHKRVTDLMTAQKAAKVDLLRTEVRLADLSQRVVAEQNAMSILLRVLNNFLGLGDPGPGVEIKGDLELGPVDVNLPGSVARAYSKRSDYLAGQKEAEAQAKRLKAARAGRWPIVSAVGTYGMRYAAEPSFHPSGSDDIENVGFAGLEAYIPLFEGGSINARTRRERAKLRSSQEQLRKLRLQIRLDVETAISNMTSSRQRAIAMEKSIAQAEESLRIEREKYELGKGSITDVLDAQTALLEAQTVYFRALADYGSAVAQWRLAIGEN